MSGTVKATIELPEDLMQEIKLRAVREHRRIKDVAADALRRGLAAEQAHVDAIKHRVSFPLIHSGHPAPPGQELTPERLAQILIDQEVEWALQAAGRDPS